MRKAKARPRRIPAHILAGIDFSDGARVALEAARRFADRMNVALLVVHVYEPVQAEAIALDAAADQWLADSQLARERLQLRYGQPWVELARAATASGAIALVVGSHGRSGRQPIALGSTAARLGLVAPCPVVVVNPYAAPNRPAMLATTPDASPRPLTQGPV